MSTSTPTIRRYAPGEEPAIWRVYFEATWQSIARDYHRELCERWAPRDKDMAEWARRVADTNPWVAVIDRSIVAFAELEADGHIDYFYCLPEWQGQGIGKALMRRILDEAKRLELALLYAEVSMTAKEFFLSQGFVITKAQDNIIQGYAAPNFIMEKQVARP